MTFVCWQSLNDNDWARAPLEAAIPLLPEPPAQPSPGAPGPFAFANKDYVATMLKEAGWKGISIQPWLGRITIPGDTVAEAASFMVELGPTARLVAEAGIDLSHVEDLLANRLAAHIDKDGRVTMPAAAWIASATAP